jgi:mRNA-degrading endonuclease toxin of MazEF toxin-antitoxin module
VNRGDVYEAPVRGGVHPVVIVTRNRAIPVLANVCVVAIASRIRGLPTQVAPGPAQGLARACVANADNIFTIPKQVLARRRVRSGRRSSPSSTRRSASRSTWTEIPGT